MTQESGVRRYHIETWGCQMNQHDSEKMAGILGGLGYETTRDAREADLIYLAQPMAGQGAGPEEAPRPAPVDRPPLGSRDSRASVPEPRPVREPELALAGARTKPRNLTFNDPGEVLSGSASALGKAEPAEARGGMDGEVQTVRREGKKVGRNDPCPCGSGKKYKRCHGA